LLSRPLPAPPPPNPLARNFYFASKTDGASFSYIKTMLYMVIHIGWCVWTLLGIPGLGEPPPPLPSCGRALFSLLGCTWRCTWQCGPVCTRPALTAPLRRPRLRSLGLEGTPSAPLHSAGSTASSAPA
jgi:hypothetical protein